MKSCVHQRYWLQIIALLDSGHQFVKHQGERGGSRRTDTIDGNAPVTYNQRIAVTRAASLAQMAHCNANICDAGSAESTVIRWLDQQCPENDDSQPTARRFCSASHIFDPA